MSAFTETTPSAEGQIIELSVHASLGVAGNPSKLTGSRAVSPVYAFTKRSCDLAVSIVALLLLGPLMMILAVAIKFHDRGPVIYRQARVGHHGVLFPFYKFRSMRVDADQVRSSLLHLSDAHGHAFKMRNDPRRTKIGAVIRKYSVDELPQLLSVLLGHMSIVGPRPHLPHEVEAYSGGAFSRLSVKPGLICLREVSGRSDLSFEEWLRLDLKYVQEQSLLLDAKIFLLAIPAVLSARGAY